MDAFLAERGERGDFDNDKATMMRMAMRKTNNDNHDKALYMTPLLMLSIPMIDKCNIYMSSVWVNKMKAMREGQEKEKEDKERARKVADDGKLNSGLEAFGKLFGDGSKVDNHNHPIMLRMSALAIVKVLMPKVAPTLNLANYTTLKTCMKGLGELAGVTTWVDKMKAMKEGNEQKEINPTPLFDS